MRPPDCVVTCQRLTNLPFLIALTVTGYPTDSDREEKAGAAMGLV